jgi:hypothetical protein
LPITALAVAGSYWSPHVQRLLAFAFFPLASFCLPATAQTVVPFNFDNAPLHASLPLNVVEGGVTAALSATGQGYSIQDSSAPVAPVGFTGRFIYPNSIYAADLLIGFSQTVTAFSIQYSPQELGCDDSCTMRVTAFRNNVPVGTNTTTVQSPGTWPVGTLGCTFVQGFDRVVVHYDAPPPTCQDYGVIFIADNMSITLAPAGVWSTLGAGCAGSLPASTLTAAAPPQIGAVLQVILGNLPADEALVCIGWSSTMSGFGPLPFECTSLGMPGCMLHTSIAAVTFVTGSGGSAVYQLPIPNLVLLAGAPFFLQALVPDPAAPNGLRAVLSDAAAAVIGL